MSKKISRASRWWLGIIALLLFVAACDDNKSVLYSPPSGTSNPVATVPVVGHDYPTVDTSTVTAAPTIPLLTPNPTPISAAQPSPAFTPACIATPAKGLQSDKGGGCGVVNLPPGTPTPPLQQPGASIAGIRLTSGNQLFTAAPLTMMVKVKGESGYLIMSASLRVLDANGQPAVYGDGPVDTISMFPSMEGGDWWEARLSAPTRPGLYYFAVETQQTDQKTRQTLKSDFLLRDAPISVAADPQPLTFGFLISRNNNLRLLSADTKRERQLTFYPEYRSVAKDAVWSPDGQQIAYSYGPPPANDADEPQTAIWLINADGSGQHQLLAPAKNENLEFPRWSPDGLFIYFHTAKWLYDAQGNFSGQAWQLERVEVASGKRQMLLPNAEYPAPSRDGKRLAYVEILPEDDSAQQTAVALPTLPNGAVATPMPAGSSRLMVASPDGSNPQQVIPTAKFVTIYSPRMSPDGSKIVFAAIGGPSDVPMPAPYATPTPVASRAVNVLAAPLYHGLPWDVWMVNTDGTGLTRLTAMNEDTPCPDWSADGKRIVFIGATGLYLLDATQPGRSPTPLQTYMGVSHAQLSWFDK